MRIAYPITQEEQNRQVGKVERWVQKDQTYFSKVFKVTNNQIRDITTFPKAFHSFIDFRKELESQPDYMLGVIHRDGDTISYITEMMDDPIELTTDHYVVISKVDVIGIDNKLHHTEDRLFVYTSSEFNSRFTKLMRRSNDD